jgi:hypothetical protein
MVSLVNSRMLSVAALGLRIEATAVSSSRGEAGI